MDFFRLIPYEKGCAFLNMAIDEALSEAVRQRRSPPTLRFYGWDRPSLSIGFFQSIGDVNLTYCTGRDFPVVRRQTGGRAILHDAELTYSIAASSEAVQFRGSLLDAYTAVSNALIHGLRQAGVKAQASFSRRRSPAMKNPSCFKSLSFGEITAEGKKIIGSAQKRYKDGFLQHGSILMLCNSRELQQVLGRNSPDDFRDIGSLNDIAPELTIAGLLTLLRDAFEDSLSIKLIADGPTKAELSRARELVKNKYATQEWNHRR